MNFFKKNRKKLEKDSQPEILMFNRAVLRLILQERLVKVADKNQWTTPFSILVSLVWTLLVSDFKNAYGISATLWKEITILAIGISLCWTFFWLLKGIRIASFDDFFSSLYKSSLTKEKRRVVFLFRSRDENNIPRVLVYWDNVWGCYLLPSVRQSQIPDHDSKLAEILLNRFGGKFECYKISNIEDKELVSYKVSQRHRSYTMYFFDFYRVDVCEDLVEKFSNMTVKVDGGIEYKWMSIDELKADQMTAERNNDVLDHLKEDEILFLPRNGSLVVKHQK